MIDHVSDTFVDPFIPLNKMVESAQAGVVDDSSQQFITHADNLVHVASLVCSLTRDSDESRQVRMAAHELRSLKDQVLYAAKSLAGHPESQSAQKNMTAFKQAWINKVTHLTTSIDKVIPIQDFVAVTEAHIRDDSRHLMEKLESGDITMSVGCANVIKGRCGRLSQVILADISNNPTRYSHEQAYDIEQQLEHLENKSRNN
jgi:catenin alpha